MTMIGPEFTGRKPRFNHVAMSFRPEELDEEHRKLRADFYGDVFGFTDIPMMTVDQKRQVFQVHNIEQFLFLIADDPAMSCARLDHFGLSVAEESELDDILARARAWQERDDRVEIIDKKVDDHGMLAITSIYVRFLLPMMLEIQWWDYHEPKPRATPTQEQPSEQRLELSGDHELRYGAFAPQGWKLEYSGWDGPRAWARTKELAQLTEELGYHHIWVYDHVETVPRREPTHVFEAFTTLAALAQHTSTIKLGQMVTCVAYRNAGLLAKEAACVDVFSEGRLILGIGAGWYEREYQAYGYSFPSGRERLQILEETCEVVKRLWTEETVTYQGKHLTFDEAYCDPKPVQQLPEFWIGGGGEKVTLRIEAKHADKTNWQTGLEGFVRKSGLLEQYCDEIGRDFGSIVRTHGPDCRIFDTEADMQRWLDSDGGGSLWGGTPHADYVRDNFVGTVEQVTEKVQAYVDAGCREFVLWFRDFPASDSLEAFAREVVPKISG